MKSKFSKKDLLLDDYIVARYKELDIMEADHKKSLENISREKKVLFERKLDLMGFGK